MQKIKKHYHSRFSFIIYSVIFLLIIDFAFYKDKRPYTEKLIKFYETEKHIENENSLSDTQNAVETKKLKFSRSYIDEELDFSKILPLKDVPTYEIVLPKDTPDWIKNSIPISPPAGWPVIAVIIDDMGMSSKYTKEIINLKGPYTLSYLPYAPNLKKYLSLSSNNGHELMLHFPMEPINDKLDTGPLTLKVSMNDDEFIRTMDAGFSKINKIIGVNNHMGSKLTQNKEKMSLFLQEIKKRDLIFVDSRTISTSVAADVATNTDVPNLQRDVFIDHVDELATIQEALNKLEKVAIKKGFAIGIAHPRRNTIKALKLWEHSLKSKNIALVPVSHIMLNFSDSNSDYSVVHSRQLER